MAYVLVYEAETVGEIRFLGETRVHVLSVEAAGYSKLPVQKGLGQPLPRARSQCGCHLVSADFSLERMFLTCFTNINMNLLRI